MSRIDRTNQVMVMQKKKRIRVIVIVAIIFVIPISVLSVYLSSRVSVLNQKVDVGNYTMPAESEDVLSTSIPEVEEEEITAIEEIVEGTQKPSEIYTDPKTVNILLLGLDTRNPKEFGGSRTDTIMILTLDTINKKIKLTSIMRDSLVSVPGHDLNRINTVFGYCGPEAAMETVQKYFGAKIDHYAIVNFWAVANIIDAVGGVDINVKKSEISILNTQLIDMNKSSKTKSKRITKSGVQKLDGNQAVSYMRIRHVGEADFERTERQRTVLQAIAQKDFTLEKILNLANAVPENVRTDINQVELVSLAKTAYELKGAPVLQLRLPIDGSFKMSRYKGMSILIIDFKKNTTRLKEFITKD